MLNLAGLLQIAINDLMQLRQLGKCVADNFVLPLKLAFHADYPLTSRNSGAKLI